VGVLSSGARDTRRFQAHKPPRMSICEALLTAHLFVLRKEVDLAQKLSALRRVLDSLKRLNSLMSAVNQRGDQRTPPSYDSLTSGPR
jgi:hypothetical protein